MALSSKASVSKRLIVSSSGSESKSRLGAFGWLQPTNVEDDDAEARSG